MSPPENPQQCSSYQRDTSHGPWRVIPACLAAGQVTVWTSTRRRGDLMAGKSVVKRPGKRQQPASRSKFSGPGDQYRTIQREVDRMKTPKNGAKHNKKPPVQTGARPHPEPP